MKKYKLKLDYTSDELKELKNLGEDYCSPMKAIYRIVGLESGTCDNPFKNLRGKYLAIGLEDEFDFMTDINNVVMGTAIFPEEKYVVHDKVTDRYIYFNKLEESFYWSQLQAHMPEIKTKEAWLNINPSYELRLERLKGNEEI